MCVEEGWGKGRVMDAQRTQEQKRRLKCHAEKAETNGQMVTNSRPAYSTKHALCQQGLAKQKPVSTVKQKREKDLKYKCDKVLKEKKNVIVFRCQHRIIYLYIQLIWEEI